MSTLPKIALGAWAWGNDGTFGGNLTADALRPIFEAGMANGLNLWAGDSFFVLSKESFIMHRSSRSSVWFLRAHRAIP